MIFLPSVMDFISWGSLRNIQCSLFCCELICTAAGRKVRIKLRSFRYRPYSFILFWRVLRLMPSSFAALVRF